MKDQRLSGLLKDLAGQYPSEMVAGQQRDIPRILFHIGLALKEANAASPSEVEVCDLGGGVGLFSAGCAAYGMKRTVLVDDFEDPVDHRVGSSALDLHKRLGVQVVAQDVVARGMRGIEGQFDVVVSFDSMEHWHHSPKRLFHEVVERLKPGGIFVLGVPNCVNLRKRIAVPFGRGKWSGMHDWYEHPVFRGHVREPDVKDLLYIARDLQLSNVKILGRNWLGFGSGSNALRLAARIMDYPMRLRPSLCSNIYLVGRRP